MKKGKSGVKRSQRNRPRGSGERFAKGESSTGREEEHPSARFAEYLLSRVSSQDAKANRVEPLAHLEYGEELKLKEEAMRDFWSFHHLRGERDELLPSPRPRHYRTTTRRRARFEGGRLGLGFGQVGGKTGDPFPLSKLEPEEHTAIYRFLAQKVEEASNRPVALHLNYLIVRGSYQAFSVIFNMDRLDGTIVRRLKGLGKQLEEADLGVISAFVFHDPTRSDYYFEQEAPPVPVRLKKLFGPARFPLRIGDGRYLLPPTAFSQVNESMVVPMLERVGRMLAPKGDERLIDLFCGYGLFAHFLCSRCAEVIGVDGNREAVAAAADSRRFHTAGGKVSFFARRITADSLRRLLSAPSGREIAILDPPRSGTGRDVIACLASRRPRRVVHIFCGIEEIPGAVEVWKGSGYRVARSAPLDMFPGTPNLETLVLLEPGSSG